MQQNQTVEPDVYVQEGGNRFENVTDLRKKCLSEVQNAFFMAFVFFPTKQCFLIKFVRRGGFGLPKSLFVTCVLF